MDSFSILRVHMMELYDAVGEWVEVWSYLLVSGLRFGFICW